MLDPLMMHGWTYKVSVVSLQHSLGSNEAIAISVVDDNFRILDKRFAVERNCDAANIDITRIGVQSALLRFIIDNDVLLGQIVECRLSLGVFVRVHI